MDTQPLISKPPIAWGVAQRAFPGEEVCGDLALIKLVAGGVLLAVVDGLGHGREAAAVARTAVTILENHATDALSVLVRRSHEGLARTRGAVMTLAYLDGGYGRLVWVGVGNVEAVLLRGRNQQRLPFSRAVLRSGVVGYQLPAIVPRTVAVNPGDLLVFATDGIRSDFAQDLDGGQTPQQLADYILERDCKGTDDALVLVVNYLGSGDE